MLFRRQDISPTARRGAEWIDLLVDGETVRVSVRRHPTARRLTLRVRTVSRDVTLTAPPHVPLAAANAFVQRHLDWVRTRLVRLPQQVPFAPGEIIPVRGIPHRIVHRERLRGTCSVEIDPHDGMHLLCVSGDLPHIARRIADYLKRQARTDLTAAVRRHAAALQVEIGALTLRDTASRWGSCAASGDLSFSWRLIFAPPHVLDYLAAHEVAHRLEMNHGPRYWRAVERIFPERKIAEAWLRANGAGLHSYGAE